MNETNEPEPSVQRTPALLDWSLGPQLLVFFSSACIMALELVAGRQALGVRVVM